MYSMVVFLKLVDLNFLAFHQIYCDILVFVQALKRASNPLEDWGPANSADRVGTKYARPGDPGYLEMSDMDDSSDLPPPEPELTPAEAYTNGYNSYNNNEKSAAANESFVPDEPAPPYEEAASKL